MIAFLKRATSRCWPGVVMSVMMAGHGMAASPDQAPHPRRAPVATLEPRDAAVPEPVAARPRRPLVQLISLRRRAQGDSGGAFASMPAEKREAGADYTGAYAPADDGHQTGPASWYGGPAWNGHRTSDGGRFSDSELTAAHATLPMGSLVRVTLGSGERSVVVRINDRPGTRRRIIDLSRAAAAALGMLGSGVAVVTLSPL